MKKYKEIKIYIKKNPIPYIALRGRKPFRACFHLHLSQLGFSLNVQPKIEILKRLQGTPVHGKCDLALASLWLWGINIEYTKLGRFFPKSNQNFILYTRRMWR